MDPRPERFLWRLAVGALTAIALWPIWSARFPPMQDYPGQVFYAEVLRLHGDPASDFDRYYEFRFHPVYATFYLTTLAFARVLPIELAGKLSLSIYPALIALLALRLRRRLGGSGGFGALLLFPFAFNQQYFYGNINYFLSLPLFLFALLDFEEFLEGPLRTRSVVRQAAWQVALVVTHPLSHLVYAGMALACGLLTLRRTDGGWRKLGTAAAIALTLLAAVWLEGKGLSPSEGSMGPKLDWLPLPSTLGFFALMFDGMQPWNRPDVGTLLLWAGVLVLAGLAFASARRARDTGVVPRRFVIALGLATLGWLALPFQIGDFTYINVRIAALVYFLIALLVAHLPFGRLQACGLVALLGLCMVASAAKQARLSAEAEEILPVLQRIPPRSRILPLIFDPVSEELDPYWFGPHVQEYNYFHVVVGGGFNPYLFGSPVDPVRVRAAETRPAPRIGRPDEFRWERHGADYQYFLVRGAPPGLAPYLGLHADNVYASGKWMLFKRR